MLSLRIELLTGRYVASEFNDRDRAEWPPHPARLFSALVAVAFDQGPPPEDQRAALRWLETQPPPHLHCSLASPRSVATHYVPVNDKALSDAAKVQSAWDAVHAPNLTDKQRAKAEDRLRKAYARSSAPDKKLGKEFRAAVAHVLPASRTRQPRTFPSLTPHDPVVWMSWPDTPTPEIRAGLDALAHRLVRLGHSSSLVAAHWTDTPPERPTWVPDTNGSSFLRWVGPGQLDALSALYAAAPNAEQRVMPYVVARYRSVDSEPEPELEPVATGSRFDSHFIVLRRVDGARLPITAAEAVADAVRRALLSHADDPIPPLISGHEPGGGPVQADHLAVVPLPFVGHRQASGDLLGVALVPPAGLSRDALRPLYAAIARWESASAPTARPDARRSVLTMGSLGAWTLERQLDRPALRNLRERTWCDPSKIWASVTPVVLDRHPGSFLDRTAARRARAVDRAHATLIAACTRIGLPAPERIELGPAPRLVGSEPAARFTRRRGTRDSRPLVHVRLTFAEKVAGPVLLGAGRYRGLGLLRPLEGGAA